MKNPLNKRIPREMIKNAGRYLSIFLILTATILIGSAFMAVMESMEHTLENNQLEARVEDGHFEVEETLSEEVQNELKEKGITLVESTYITFEEFDSEATLRVYSNREELNTASVFEGSLPKTPDDIALDRLFADSRGIVVGEEVLIDERMMKVCGTISLPDYNSLFKNNSSLVMETTMFGPAIVTPECFASLDGGVTTLQYSYRFEERNLTEDEKETFSKECVATLMRNGIRINSLLTAEKNQGISFLANDMGKDGPMMNVLICVLVAILAFVFAVLISNTIEEEAPVIGTLRASGYTKGELIRHYLAPTVIVAVTASVIGNGIGYTLMIRPFLDIYYSNYSVSPCILRFSLKAFLMTTVIPVVIMLVVNYIMLARKLFLSPLRFLRKDLKHKKQKRAVQLPQMTFFRRFRMRVILQNKESYLVLMVGVFMASFLLMFGIGLMPLIDHYVDEVNNSTQYNYQYVLKAPCEPEVGPETIYDKLTIYSLKASGKYTDGDAEIMLFGLAESSGFFSGITNKVTNMQGERSVVFSDSVANKLGVAVGERVTFRDNYTDKDYTLTVGEVVKYAGAMAVFLPQAELNEMLGFSEDYFNCCVSNVKLPFSETDVARMISRSDLTGAATQMVASFKDLLVLVSIFAICIYVVMMYLLTKVVIEKNAICIAFMKVFGYEKSEISKLYLRATTITVLFSLAVCLPMEAFLFKQFLNYIMSMVEGWISFYLPWTVYAIIVVAGIVSYFGINWFHVRRIERIPMNAALKCRE